MDITTLDSMVEDVNRRILEFKAPDVPEIGYRGVSDFSDEEKSRLVAKLNEVLLQYTSLLKWVTEEQRKIGIEKIKYGISEALKRQIGEHEVSILTENGITEVTLENISSIDLSSDKISLAFKSKQSMEKFNNDIEEIRKEALENNKQDPEAVNKMKGITDYYSKLVDIALEFVQLKPIEQNNSHIATIFYTTDKNLYAITLNLNGNSNNKGQFDLKENSIEKFISEMKGVLNGKKLDFYKVESPFSEDTITPFIIFQYFANKMQNEYDKKNPDKAAEREKIGAAELPLALMVANMLKEKLSGKSQGGQYGEQVNVMPSDMFQKICPRCPGKDGCDEYKAAEEIYGKGGRIIWN